MVTQHHLTIRAGASLLKLPPASPVNLFQSTRKLGHDGRHLSIMTLAWEGVDGLAWKGCAGDRAGAAVATYLPACLFNKTSSSIPFRQYVVTHTGTRASRGGGLGISPVSLTAKPHHFHPTIMATSYVEAGLSVC